MTITQTTILVKPDLRWNTALARFGEQGLWIQPVGGVGSDWIVYAVESHSGRAMELSHTVTVDLTVSPTEVSCDCPAGRMGIPCTHSAAALREALAFPYATLGRLEGLGNPLMGTKATREALVP